MWCFFSVYSQWGVLPDANEQRQPTTWVWSVIVHHWGNQQHHFWIHPQKHCKFLGQTSVMASYGFISDQILLFCQVMFFLLKFLTALYSNALCVFQDIFAVAVSLITGKIVYISDQAATILNCKREVFHNAKFVEFLTPQDVSVFYSFTTPYRLPSWSMCTGAGNSNF